MAEKKEVKEKAQKTILEPGEKVKVVEHSEASSRHETVAGIHEGKVGKFGSAPKK